MSGITHYLSHDYNNGMSQNIKITKQSLVDWEVTVAGQHIAWIAKTSFGYSVEYPEGSYPKLTFNEARAFIRECEQIV